MTIDPIRLVALATAMRPSIRAAVNHVPDHGPLRRGEIGTVEGVTLHQGPKHYDPRREANAEMALRIARAKAAYEHRNNQPQSSKHSHAREIARHRSQQERAAAKLAKRTARTNELFDHIVSNIL